MKIGAFSKGKAILVDDFMRSCVLPMHILPLGSEVGNVVEISVKLNRGKERQNLVFLH